MVWKYGLPAALSFVSCFAVAPALLGQAPAIESAGVQNAASNATLASLASQMLVTIKGHNLASSAACQVRLKIPHCAGRKFPSPRQVVVYKIGRPVQHSNQPVKRRRAMQECNPPRNSWLQTHQDDGPQGEAG
jgi:hypothetical protein